MGVGPVARRRQRTSRVTRRAMTHTAAVRSVLRAVILVLAASAAVPGRPTGQVASLTPGVQALTTAGATNMAAGLQSALDLLENQPNPSIILLTDGWNNDGMSNDEVLRGPVAAAASARVPVCTV